MGKKKISLKEIALECGVSINTVSHALRDMSDISPEMKSMIRRKAFELGYMPNQVAQTMKIDEKPAVAIVTNSFGNLYYNSLCEELLKLFIENGEYDFVLLFSPPSLDMLDISVVKQCILQRIDLLLSHMRPTEEALELAKLSNIHIVLIGSYTDLEDMDTVTIDNKMGCELAAKYLSNFHSGAKYLYVGVSYFLSDLRYALFAKEVNKLVGKEALFFNIEKEDISVLFRYIDDGYRNVFFFSDSVAYEALSKLDRRVVDVRKLYPDLHIVGCDGLCEVVSGLRQISTVTINFPEYAGKTYGVIKKRLDEPLSAKQSVVLPVSLHQRRKKE